MSNRSASSKAAKCLIVLGVLFILTEFSYAQSLGRVAETESNIQSYYFFVEPGSPTVQVNVLGTVRWPGLYEIMEGTDLRQLLALSGGPLLNVQQSISRRRVTVRLFRAATEEPLYEADFDRMIVNTESYPTLRDGDVLTVDVVERTRFTWRDFASIVGAVGSLAWALERIRN